MTDTGYALFQYASTSGSADANWADWNEVLGEDASPAYAQFNDLTSSPKLSNSLLVNTPNLSVPANAEISDIYFQVNCAKSSAFMPNFSMRVQASESGDYIDQTINSVLASTKTMSGTLVDWGITNAEAVDLATGASNAVLWTESLSTGNPGVIQVFWTKVRFIYTVQKVALPIVF